MTTTYDSPEWAALLAGIRADPDADLPRLVAADWLDDHGKPLRAEIIRLSVAAAAGDTRPAVGDRLGRIVNLCRPHSLGLMCAYDRRPGHGWRRVRGFFEEVTCAAGGWVQYAAGLLAREPVRRVRFTQGSWHTPRIGHIRRDWPDIEFTPPEPVQTVAPDYWWAQQPDGRFAASGTGPCPVRLGQRVGGMVVTEVSDNTAENTWRAVAVA